MVTPGGVFRSLARLRGNADARSGKPCRSSQRASAISSADSASRSTSGSSSTNGYTRARRTTPAAMKPAWDEGRRRADNSVGVQLMVSRSVAA